MARAEAQATAAVSRPWTLQQEVRADRGVQKTVHFLLKESEHRYPVIRLRALLEKYDLAPFPCVAADRAKDFLCRIQSLVPPRVSAAIFRTYYKGWCTASRFGRRAGCIFGCQDLPDRLGHYLVCPVATGFARSRLRLEVPQDPRSRRTASLSLHLAGSSLTENEAIRRAIWLAAVYRVHCRFRRQPGQIQKREVAQRALDQAVRDLTHGHRSACKIVDELWRTVVV